MGEEMLERQGGKEGKTKKVRKPSTVKADLLYYFGALSLACCLIFLT
jgi:hypothetical protein